ncbi:CcdB family protein [Sphingomonas sp.]|jgi:toxin CcdB|uniref:CcdB family protein n=1 Tax=Sphingomonas sp. TaxID=28214 RepID=UPI002E307B7B|nr:CcdB family protein [Sphingomonas sp.]HEX4693828.1 CcdB family protein [Sphingomonas sp.]
MARFDVYRTASGALLLDCQTDFLSGIETRLVAPLMPVDHANPKLPRLNPVFEVAGARVAMVTTLLVGIPKSELGKKVGSLADEQPTIMNAIDMLLSGF